MTSSAKPTDAPRMRYYVVAPATEPGAEPVRLAGPIEKSRKADAAFEQIREEHPGAYLLGVFNEPTNTQAE